ENFHRTLCSTTARCFVLRTTLRNLKTDELMKYRPRRSVEPRLCRHSLASHPILCLQMPEFGTYPLGQQFRYRRGNELFTTMTAAIKTWGAYSEPPKHRIETAAPIIL